MKETTTDLVSVIMCFFNAGPWIAEAIESVLAQSISNIELILVDDGSTDNSSAVARFYASRLPDQVIYADHPGHINRGLTISRNTGISLASGAWVAFLDADDCWLPEKIENQLRLSDLNPEAAMICEASTFWYSWNDPSATDACVKVGVPADKMYRPYELFEQLYPLGSGAAPCPSGLIIRADALREIGGFENSFSGIYGLYEDQAFLAKVYLNRKVYVSGKANNLYRKRQGSMTDSLTDENLYRTVRLFFLEWLTGYLQANPGYPSYLTDLVKKTAVHTKNTDGLRSARNNPEVGFLL